MEYRWSIESDERDFERLNQRYESEPSRVAYGDAVGIENIVGMHPRMDMD
ncbi:MAG: hypothetical protein GF368_00995 [Candidatus Aenigmarchaeota archaeon]|nr:hypothetical protein [Candidatus Aenigmarchaeota archaeon]